MPRKVFAVASAGGHWQQLMQLQDAYRDQNILYATTLQGLPEEFDANPAVILPDCNRDDKRSVLRCFLAVMACLMRFRPDVVITTGALPGLIALFVGRVIGARTIWVDSVANAEEMSMSGRLAKRLAHRWLSQWEHVAEAAGAEYAGAVL